MKRLRPHPALAEWKHLAGAGCADVLVQGHGAAGEGQSWQPAGGDRAANQRAKSSLGAPMRRTNETLPEGFLNAISHTHVGKQVCTVVLISID